jgi:hypothetical protein
MLASVFKLLVHAVAFSGETVAFSLGNAVAFPNNLFRICESK